MINIGNRIDLTARYEVLRSGAVVTYIYADDTPSINMQSESELKLSLSGTFHDYSADTNTINFLSDKLRVIVNLNDTEYTCGIYCITSETLNRNASHKTISVEGYSLLYLPQQSKIESRLYYAAGTLYTNVIAAQLIASGITDYTVTASTLTLATDREDWEIGTSRLEIINQLLKEISYNSAYMNNLGKIICEPYTEPTYTNLDFTYNADTASIIGPDYTVSNDYHGKKNVFKVICNNPELASPLTATSENIDESSPFCIDNIGRRLHIERIDNVANQAALQLYADTLRFKSLISSEEVTFETAINPEHSVFNIVALNNDTLSGIYAETSWTMQISANAMMTHRARRALYKVVEYVPLIDSESNDIYDSDGSRINMLNTESGVTEYVSDYTAEEIDTFIEAMEV